MRALLRWWAPALLLGLAASLGLFWLMHWMISDGNPPQPETQSRRLVDFVRLKREPPPPPETRKPPPKPPEKVPPPPKPALATPQPVTAKTPNIDMPPLDISVSQRLRSSLTAGIEVAPGGSPNAGLIPLVRVPPRYPMRARMRRTEGWVKLEFTVTRDGSVEDVRVVEAHPRGVFDRAAIRAISRWKFKPLEIDGRKVEQRAVQVLEFKLRQ
ncbi:energy transducer TonB [Methylohalobius crimeensis]|uniref:energy transducer TonB n=1 Tax=Methylohalobius crimeensis TaxID=244365 RepID=UPI0003B36744|nr:energy transducer TonB [Methylohalobius crimeensis]